MRSLFTATLITVALSACGGGGGGDSSTDASGKTAPATSIGQIGGTYIMPCTGRTFNSREPDAIKSESSIATIVITPDPATGKASISARLQYYLNSANCDEAALDTDLTFNGTASDTTASKNYRNADGKPVTAKVATIAYTGIRLSRGNLNVKLPMPGATTNMAYVMENNMLYLSKGHREADGLGNALTAGAVKQ